MSGSHTSRNGNLSWVDLFLEHEDALFAYALFLERNVHDAEDLVQTVLVRLARKQPCPHDGKAYVMRCLRNASNEQRRRRTAPRTMRFDADQTVAALRIGPAAEDDAHMRERTELVRRALGQLDEAKLEIVTLKLLSGLSLREIANLLDRPLGTIASSYARALDELRAILAMEFSDG